MPNNRLYSLSDFLKDGIFNETTSAFDKVESVFVPMIQRPYAQGRRADAETEIRRNFVRKIFEHLAALKTDPQKRMELNFVYGSFTDSRFELLDGQQRLTTLFLLSWYIAMRSGQSFTKDSDLAKFTYQTRTTSTEFIKKLLTGNVEITGSPSSMIKKQPWYTSAFSKDSTVTGMLTMLDEIHSRYEDTADDCKPAFEDLDSIRFYLLELNNFGLTDELFIKMNARGLQLTPFENFKAELTGWIKKDPFADGRYDETVSVTEGSSTSTMPYWLYFSSRVDGKWADIFWEMPGEDEKVDPDNLGAEESDRKFFSFIKRWLANCALTLSTDTLTAEGAEFFRYFNGKAADNSYYSFDKIREFLEWTNSLKADIIKQLGKTLRFFSDSALRETIEKSFIAPWDRSSQMPWDARMEMRPMIVFSAICEFILTQPDDPALMDEDEFARWMRIVHNIVQNRDINAEAAQIVLTRQLKTALTSGTQPIYPRFRDFVDGLGGKSNREFTAERDKIKLILKDKAWEEAFKTAERDPFMTGAVNFYLNEADGIDKYKERTERVPLLFDASGVKKEFSENNTLLRGIVTRMFDYSAFKLNNYNISLSNKNAADRFLKNLTVYNSNPQCNRLFREVLDCPDVDSMKTKLDDISHEVHTLVCPNSMDEAAKTLLQKGYATLHSLDHKNPLGWLASLGENSMKIYFFEDGRAGLYKGPVNCMYFNVDMETFIPALENKLTAKGLTVKYPDQRPVKAFNKFGLYSGSSVVLYAGENDEYVIWIGNNFKAEIYCTDAGRADAISLNADPTFKRNLSLQDGQRKTWDYEQRHLYLAFVVPDIRSATAGDGDTVADTASLIVSFLI